MNESVNPCGVTVTINYEGKVYYGHLYNDWNLFKTIGNYDIEVEDGLILFDENFDRIPYDSPLYVELTPIVEEFIIQ